MSAIYAELTTPLAETLSRTTNGDRIVLCGPYPDAGAYRAWLEDVPPGWSVRLSRAQSNGRCEGRYSHTDGREVRVTSLAAWGAPAMDPAAAKSWLSRLATRVNQEFKREGILPLVSPAVCGVTLWREIGEAEHPPLPEWQQTVIRATSGQGRAELFWDGHLLPGFHYWDMRLAYAAVCENLPVGPVTIETNGAIPFHGRVRLAVRIPRTWNHVGILPLKLPNQFHPTFPHEPGRRFETWCDAREARLAAANGWDLTVLESWRMEEGKPLNLWVRRLLRVHDEYDRAGERDLARAVRAIILQTIGDLHGRGRTTERVLRAGDVTAVRRVRGERAAARPSHPEWTAAIWARCRYRLTATLLQVPRAELVGCYVDALYTAAAQPWPDDGKPGRLREKGQLPGPLPAPVDLRSLTELAGAAEDAMAAG